MRPLVMDLISWTMKYRNVVILRFGYRYCYQFCRHAGFQKSHSGVNFDAHSGFFPYIAENSGINFDAHSGVNFDAHSEFFLYVAENSGIIFDAHSGVNFEAHSEGSGFIFDARFRIHF